MTKFILPLVAIAMASSASAALIVNETFNYATGVLGTKAVTGTGLTGNWAGNYNNANNPPFTGSAGGSIVNNWSYTAPTNYVSSPSNNSLRAAGFSESIAKMTTGINADTTATYYVSFFYQVGTVTDTASSYANVGLTTTQTNNTDTLNFGKRSGGTVFGMQFAGVGFTDSSVSITANTAYLIVLKLSINGASGTNDTLQFKAFTSADVLGSAEPVLWDQTLTGNLATTTVLNGIGFRSGTGQTEFRTDEFRLGTTWGDVAAIPEPSAFAALAGLGVLGLAAGRRRRR